MQFQDIYRNDTTMFSLYLYVSIYIYIYISLSIQTQGSAMGAVSAGALNKNPFNKRMYFEKKGIYKHRYLYSVITAPGDEKHSA